ncbi:MAG TPA: O-antigen ligase family protein [Coriobacteriia bacterium]|nr:O-antigen ligase family protein [Coriobacteriia bacterium]
MRVALRGEYPGIASPGSLSGGHAPVAAAAPVAVAALAGAAAWVLDPLWALPLLAVAAWYAVVRVAAAPAALVAWIAAYSLLGDKMVISLGVGGGEGLLRLGPLVSIGLMGALLLADEGARRAAVDVVRWGAPAALFVAFGTALPLIGALTDYPLRTVSAAIIPLATGASLVFGVLVARSGVDRDRVRYVALTSITVVAALAGLVLFLHYRGITLPLAITLHEWGLATAEAYGGIWLIGRVGGLYTNPNILATLGGLALVFAAFGRVTLAQRVALVMPALAIMLVTQSRGALVGALVAVCVGAAFGRRRSSLVRWQTIITWMLVVAVAVVAVAGAAVAFPHTAAALADRIASAVRVITEGVHADPNLAGRVVFWSAAWDLLQHRVLGTFGPPELLLGTAIDNDYLRFALQGGFLYAGAWILYLAWLMSTGLRGGADRFVGAGAVFLALTAITQTPSAYVMVIGMFSLFVGMHVERLRVEALRDGARATREGQERTA